MNEARRCRQSQSTYWFRLLGLRAVSISSVGYAHSRLRSYTTAGLSLAMLPKIGPVLCPAITFHSPAIPVATTCYVPVNRGLRRGEEGGLAFGESFEK
jgi:hypothetical protein